MMVRDVTNVVAIVEQQPLQSLIAEVRGCIRALKSHEAKTPKLRVRAGEKLAALRKRVEAEGAEWWPWFEEQEDLCSRTEAFRLLRIAGAPDPEAEEERQRQANNESHRNAREESRTSETQSEAEKDEGPPKKVLVTCATMIANAMLWLDPRNLEAGSKKDRAFLLNALQEALPKIRAIIAELKDEEAAPDGLDKARDHYTAEFAKLPLDDRDAETDRLIQALREAS